MSHSKKENVLQRKRPTSLPMLNGHNDQKSSREILIEANRIFEAPTFCDFNHHNPPPERKFEISGNTDDYQEVLQCSDPDVGLKTCPTEDEIRQQIDYWFARECRYNVNSVRMDIREIPYVSIVLFKVSGTTIGQLVHLSIKEVEYLIEFLAAWVIPEISKCVDEKRIKIRSKKFTQKGKINVKYVDFVKKQVPLDTVCTLNAEKPTVQEVAGKIKDQRSKPYYYEKGINSFDTISAHVTEINGRWYIGLYKRIGEGAGNCIWFSIYEAQWILQGLMTLYDQTIKYVDLLLEIQL